MPPAILSVRVLLAVKSPPPVIPNPAEMVRELVALLAKFAQSAEERNPFCEAVEVACETVHVPEEDAIVMPDAPLVANVIGVCFRFQYVVEAVVGTS